MIESDNCVKFKISLNMMRVINRKKKKKEKKMRVIV